MARVTKDQVKAIVLGDEKTYPRDLAIWVGTLGVVGDAPFYLTHTQLSWFYAYIEKGRKELNRHRKIYKQTYK